MATSRCHSPPRFSRWYVTVPRRRHTEDRSVSRVSAAVNVNTTAHELIASARKHRASSRYGPPISNPLKPLIPRSLHPTCLQTNRNRIRSNEFAAIRILCRRVGQCLPMFDPSVATCLLHYSPVCLCVSVSSPASEGIAKRRISRSS